LKGLGGRRGRRGPVTSLTERSIVEPVSREAIRGREKGRLRKVRSEGSRRSMSMRLLGRRDEA
jgi:hypothetical protein